MTRFLVRILGLAVLTLVFGFVVFVLTLPGPAGDEKTDAVVVLTGGAGRIARGLEQVRTGRAKRLLISGVDRTVRPVELARAAEQPQALFDCCVDLGFGAVDTRSNGEETAAWMRRHRYRSVRLVTSAWHMPRARLELAARIGPDVLILSDAVPSERAPAAMIEEYAKYVLRLGALGLGI
jgi:uncharacterized SAM-binding protein YcdF (DUF218 family)